MLVIAALGWGRPVTEPVRGGWDWWVLAGAIGLFALIATSRRRPPMPLAIGLAAFGGLVVGDLTESLGVVPVWGPLLIVLLMRNLIRGSRGSQV